MDGLAATDGLEVATFVGLSEAQRAPCQLASTPKAVCVRVPNLEVIC